LQPAEVNHDGPRLAVIIIFMLVALVIAADFSGG